MTSKNQEFQPISNPYIVGKPIEDRDMFFGRLDDFEFIRKKVSGAEKGGIIVLCGSRRSGKTSILFQIRRGRLGERFLPVLIDMQSMTARSDEEFLSKLVMEVISAIQDSRISFEKDYLEGAKKNPFKAFQHFAEKVSSVVKDKKLIIMFDEYELFESHIGKGNFSTDILDALSSWMEHRKGVFLIFTGSDRLEARKTAFWDRFLPKAIHRRISFISETDTFRLIEEPVRGIVNYHEGVKEEIFSLTAGQPFYTQVICQSIIDHLNENQNYDVSIDDINEVVKYIIENPLPQMIFAWNSLSDYAKFILSIMAEISKEGNEPVDVEDICNFPEKEDIGYRLDSNKIREYAEKLFHSDYLVKSEPGKRYLFKMDLWRRWIVLMHSIWQVINELGNRKHKLEEGIVSLKKEKETSIKRALALILAVAALAVISFIFINTFILSGSRERNMTRFAVSDSTIVSIDSEPQGALAFIDGKYFGHTPIDSRAAEAGSVLVNLQLDGYITLLDTVELVKDVPSEISYKLIPRTGALKITSTPEGAKGILHNHYINFRTPCIFEKLPITENYTLTLSKDGFEDIHYPGFQIEENETTVVHLELSPLTHAFTIESDPNRADIYLDGNFVGKTPKSITDLVEGAHTLEIRLKGYKTETATVKIPYPRDLFSVDLTELPPGTLILRMIPWADLYLDGAILEKESLSKTLTLKEGIHIIELKHKDYGAFADTLEVKSGIEITREYNLREMSRK